MILKMRKYSFLVYHGIYLEFLEKIRDIGVLHVIGKSEGTPDDETLSRQMQLANRLSNALTLLEANLPENAVAISAAGKAGDLDLLDSVEKLHGSIEHLNQQIFLLDKEKERISVLGDFSEERLQTLADSGFDIRFFSCNMRKFDPAWVDQYHAFEISTVGSQIYFVTVNKPGVLVDIEADPVKMPEKNIAGLEEQIAGLRNELDVLVQSLRKLAVEKSESLRKLYKETVSEVDFSRVVLNTESGAEGKVMILEGFCPDEVEGRLREYLDASGVFYQAENPDITEDIPIKLKNNAFSKLFEPITKLFSLPNYSELDPTPFFAPFFMLFFGLCLGDGGYGLIIWLLTTVLKRKAKPEMRGLLALGQYLGLSTVVVGILTGSFLGIALDQVEWKWLANVKQYFITQDNFGAKFDGYNPMMIVAVVIGIIQILFGMVVNAMKVTKQHGFKFAVGHIAWIVFIISMIVYLAVPSEMSSPILSYVLYGLIGLSVLCILFYNSPGKNIFMNMGSALWNTYNMATGLLGDTLSYIRLFALGLTGSILGGVFNTLAFDLTSGIAFAPGKWLAILLILLVGHAINFGLCLIGAFVHPLRLTFVEFYKNAGFEGGGKEYKPFKKQV